MRTQAWIICLSLLTGTAALAAPASDAAGGVLRQEKRLQNAITLRARDQPLSELLADVGKRTGVRLRTTRLTGDDKVTLFVKDRPAAEILARIAAHFDFQWSREGEVYELGQGLAAQNRERKLRENAVAEHLRDLRARLDLLSRMASTPRDRLEARRTELATRLRAGNLAPEELARLSAEMQAVTELLAPGALASLTIYRQLTPAQSAQLTTTGELRFSTAAGTLGAPLAEQIHAAAAEMLRSGRVMRVSTDVGGGGGAAAAPGNPVENEPPIGATAQLTLDDTSRMPFGGRGHGRQPLNLRFMLMSIRGEGGRQSSFPVMWSSNPGTSGRTAERPATDTNDPELKREVEVGDPEKGAAARNVVPPAAGLFLAGGPSALPGFEPLSRMLEQLHEKTGLSILSDSFISARLDPRGMIARQAISRHLDAWARQLDYDWKRENGLIELRSRWFFQDRPEEIADRQLRPWRDALRKAGTFGLDDLATIMAALTDPQARSLQQHWRWYLEAPGLTPPDPPMGLFENRFHLRFWAGLSPQQRQVARNEILPVNRMTSPQRAAYTLALESRSQMPAPALGGREGPATPAEIAAGGFTLRTAQSTMQTLSGVGPEGKRIALSTVELPRPGGGAPAAPQLEGVTFDNVVRRTLDSYSFYYHLAGEVRPARIVSLQVPRPAPRTEPK